MIIPVGDKLTQISALGDLDPKLIGEGTIVKSKLSEAVQTALDSTGDGTGPWYLRAHFGANDRLVRFMKLGDAQMYPTETAEVDRTLIAKKAVILIGNSTVSPEGVRALFDVRGGIEDYDTDFILMNHTNRDIVSWWAVDHGGDGNAQFTTEPGIAAGEAGIVHLSNNAAETDTFGVKLLVEPFPAGALANLFNDLTSVRPTLSDKVALGDASDNDNLAISSLLAIKALFDTSGLIHERRSAIKEGVGNFTAADFTNAATGTLSNVEEIQIAEFPTIAIVRLAFAVETDQADLTGIFNGATPLNSAGDLAAFTKEAYTVEIEGTEWKLWTHPGIYNTLSGWRFRLKP